jgi:ATPase subunit of ABC transporter with duplicated ATPase domains
MTSIIQNSELQKHKKLYHKTIKIFGPPGTGKTQMLSVLLGKILQLERRALVCAPSNVAVQEVALRVLRDLRKHRLPMLDYAEHVGAESEIDPCVVRPASGVPNGQGWHGDCYAFGLQSS